jgi:serine/threonine-protein kinase
MTGRTVSHYQILEKLGEGGMGVVFKARDTRLDRLVALKFLPSRLVASEAQVARFEQEARALAALSHSHIATIHDVGEVEGERFLVFEYLAGGTLKSRIQGGPLPISDVTSYGIQLAEALGHAHQHGIVHRDVKSENVMFTADGILKLTDFGLAKLAGSAELTQTGFTVGTAAYMSPEQAQGLGADHRSDIFSLGVVLFEMAAGELPFRGDRGVAVLYEIINTAAPSLLQRRPDAPERLEDIVLRALEKNRDYRYQSMDQVIQDLRDVPSTRPAITTSRHRARAAAVAVLPFANLSTDPENEYFSDGLTEDLITALSQLEGLRVVARTSAFQFKGKARDIREVGRQLNVGVVVEGSVRRFGEKVRVTAQLVNVADGFQIWSERHDRELKDVFAIQDEICGAIVKALKVKLTGEEDRPLVKKYTDNLEAYQHLLKGRYYWNQWTEEGFRRGMEHYGKAIAADPGYAPAYAGLADCFNLLSVWGLAAPVHVMPQAKTLALKAVELDDSLSEAHCALGAVLGLYDWDWPGAERELSRSLELNPGNATAHVLYGFCYLGPVGRWNDAVKSVRRAVELDPLSMVAHTYVGTALWLAGRAEEAIREHRRTIEIDPHFAEAWRCLGWALLTPPRFDEAIAAFEKARSLAPTPISLGDLGYTLARAGRAGEARAILAQLQEIAETAYVPGYSIAAIHIGLGDLDAAFEWLQRAVEERSSWLVWLNTGPVFEPLRADARFVALRRQVFPSL